MFLVSHSDIYWFHSYFLFINSTVYLTWFSLYKSTWFDFFRIQEYTNFHLSLKNMYFYEGGIIHMKTPSDLPFKSFINKKDCFRTIVLDKNTYMDISSYADKLKIPKRSALAILVRWGIAYWTMHQVALYRQKYPKKSFRDVLKHFFPDQYPFNTEYLPANKRRRAH